MGVSKSPGSSQKSPARGWAQAKPQPFRQETMRLNRIFSSFLPFAAAWFSMTSACGSLLNKRGVAHAPDDSASAQAPVAEGASSTGSATATDTGAGDTSDEQSCGIWCKEKEPEPHVACALPAGAPTRPAKIADLVTLLNLLPRPVSLPCLLDVLPKPYELTATTGRFSLQPAHDSENPRFFVFIDDLVLSFVPDGPDRELLEVSELLSESTSVKGELEFPLTTQLPTSAFYDHVKRTDGIEGTRCGRCHNGEAAQPGAEYEGKAFVSQALRPLDREMLPLGELRALGAACKGVVARRCDILRALFGDGTADAKERPFPTAMPTMF